MAAKVICVVNAKGGCGKTTLSMNMAGAFAGLGLKTALIDGDTQGTAVRWSSAGGPDTTFSANVFSLAEAGSKVSLQVRKHIMDYDLLIIDCPPSIENPVPESAMMVADLVLIPMIPSPNDAWAGRAAKKLLERVAEQREMLAESSGGAIQPVIARIVPNMVHPNANLTKSVLAVIMEFGIPVSASKLGYRIAYQEAAADATDVVTVGQGRTEASIEMIVLIDEVVGLLGLKKPSALVKLAKVAKKTKQAEKAKQANAEAKAKVA